MYTFVVVSEKEQDKLEILMFRVLKAIVIGECIILWCDNLQP